MMRATVHNLHRESMRDGDVYIGRAGYGRDGYFGNPFPVQERSRRIAIDQFEEWARRKIAQDPEYRERVKALHGKRLFCFCVDADGKGLCHGHVLARLAEELNAGSEP